MPLRIHNSMTGRKEAFEPLEPGHVRMYVCGITVYDHIHVGHARSQIAFDVARRWLRASGYRVTYVRNITDIDDKIIDRARERGEPIEALTARFIASMDEDFAAIGLEKPDHEPRATAFIPEIVVDDRPAGCSAATPTSARTATSTTRSRASRRTAGSPARNWKTCVPAARVEVDESKRDPLDFVLWKHAKPGEPAWDSPWGMGRPGLAHRVLGDGGRAARPGVRHPRRRHGPQVPAPRERDRPELRGLRRAVREALDAQRLRARGRREDVEVARQLLHGARGAAAAAPGGAARLPARLPLPRAGQLHRRQPAPGRRLAAAPLPRAAGRRAGASIGAGRGDARVHGGHGRRLQHAGRDRRAAVSSPRAQRRQGRRRPRAGAIARGRDPAARAESSACSNTRRRRGSERARSSSPARTGSPRVSTRPRSSGWSRPESRHAARATSPSPTASATSSRPPASCSRTEPPAPPGGGSKRGRSPFECGFERRVWHSKKVSVPY